MSNPDLEEAKIQLARIPYEFNQFQNKMVFRSPEFSKVEAYIVFIKDSKELGMAKQIFSFPNDPREDYKLKYQPNRQKSARKL